jgi:C4-dicarboxylate transporter, DctM subunit
MIFIGSAGIIALLILLFIGIPISFAMGLVGLVGYAFVESIGQSLGILTLAPYSVASNYVLSAVPLFILMGLFAFYSGISHDLYQVSYKWFGWMPGGMAVATVVGCAGFAAVSGTSTGGAATMGTVALPEMKRFNYDPKFSAGTVAAGGTLGILIPPSGTLIIYGYLTEESVGKLFMAGIIPGILSAALYMAMIFIVCQKNPALGPPGPKFSIIERIKSLKGLWGMGALFVLVMGGIYAGIFTPTEAGAIGAGGSLLIAIALRKITFNILIKCLLDTCRITAMIFAIIIGAMIFNHFLTVTQFPMKTAEFISGLQFNKYIILILFILIYFVMGMFMDALAIIILTVPILYPIITSLGFDVIWFGIILVKCIEVALITPPLGMNVFVIKGVASELSIHDIFRGIWYYLQMDLLTIVILIIFPQMSLWLPSVMW